MPADKEKNNSRWYVVTRYTDWQGVRKNKLKRGFATKREALEWERRFQLQSTSNMHSESGPPDRPTTMCIPFSSRCCVLIVCKIMFFMFFLVYFTGASGWLSRRIHRSRTTATVASSAVLPLSCRIASPKIRSASCRGP